MNQQSTYVMHAVGQGCVLAAPDAGRWCLTFAPERPENYLLRALNS